MAIISYVTEIRFGAGYAAELAEVSARLSFQRPLIGAWWRPVSSIKWWT